MNRSALVLLTGVLAAVFVPVAIAAGGDVRAPKPGNPERTAVLEAVRPAVEALTGQKRIVFVVERLLVSEGWAWIWGRPQTPDASHRYEDISALVKRDGKAGGGWRLVRMLGSEAGAADDPELAKKRQWSGLKRDFPDLPQVLIDAALAPDR